jgi:hypothetical protein
VLSKEIPKAQSLGFIWTVNRSGHVAGDPALWKVCALHIFVPIYVYLALPCHIWSFLVFYQTPEPA